MARSILLLGLLAVAEAFNNPSSVPVWCGKAYMASNASFNPGGQLTAPKQSASPLLDLKIRPRMSLYTSDEQFGSFVIDAGLSYIHGQPYVNSTTNVNNGGGSKPFTTLIFDVSVAGTGQDLVSHQSVPINSTDNEFQFSLAGLKPRIQPYKIQIEAASQDGSQAYTAQTEVFHLPARTDGGSAVKVDSLYGGLLVQDYTQKSKAWTPLYPYSYYASWSGYFQNNASAVSTYKSLGYNIVHVVPDGSLPYGFDVEEFDAFLTETDRAGLWVMYDMRWSYLNLTSVAAQVSRIKNHPSLLLWYTGDEPDGATDPLNGTTLAYNTIKKIDPYHPVSLVLNCANFYYKEYTAGTDIVMEDVYPIAINATYSVEWHTPCNSTYGDCGCDDCIGEFEDISTRLDNLAQYQEWIGGAPKPLWGVPQAFDGSDEYWARAPTAAEEVVMDVLSINHGAKGLVAWTWPTEPDLADVTSRFARVVTGSPVTSFLLDAKQEKVDVAPGGPRRLDVAAWRVGKQMLVSVVFLQYNAVGNTVTLTLPGSVQAISIATTMWGSSSWNVNGGKLVKKGLTGLEVDMFVVNLA